jgi:hypothetical protein
MANVNAKNNGRIDQETTERQGVGHGEQLRAAQVVRAALTRICTSKPSLFHLRSDL